MRSWSHYLLLIAGVLTCAVGCTATQQIVVKTEPTGADVYLQRSGDVTVDANVMGIMGSVEQDRYTEDFYYLGTTPVTYEFDLEETDSAVHAPGLGGGAVTRRHREGTVRVEMTGYETVQRPVRFTGDQLHMMITLEPQNEAPEQEPILQPDSETEDAQAPEAEGVQVESDESVELQEESAQ